jgi:hypothetical protein
MNDDSYFVFVVFLPDNKTPIYVGYGKDSDEYWQKKVSHKPLDDLPKEVRKHKRAIVARLYDGLTQEEAWSVEETMISDFGRRPDGPLYNADAGGRTAARARARAALVAKNRSLSADHRAKLSAALKGRKLNPEHVDKILTTRAQRRAERLTKAREIAAEVSGAKRLLRAEQRRQLQASPPMPTRPRPLLRIRSSSSWEETRSWQ